MNEDSHGPQPDPQLLHNRAAESAKETRQGIITMSSASLAVFFLSLTAKTEPPLDSVQKVFVVVALVSMAGATFSGLWSAYADAQWSYSWAKQLSNPPDSADAASWQADRDGWHAQKRWSEKTAMILFALGVFVSAIYIGLRAFGAANP